MGRDHLAGGRHERERVVGPPEQGTVLQRLERRVERGCGQIGAEQPGELGPGHRCGVGVGDDGGLQHGERDAVQVVAGAVHGRADPGAGGQHDEIGGRRHAEVGAQAQQRGERLVVLRAQRVDERAGARRTGDRRGHRLHGSPRRRAGPYGILVVPAGGSPRVSAARLPAGRTGEQPEYARYEGRSPARPAGSRIHRYPRRAPGGNHR
jgi:hypothetical protein